MKTLLFTSEFPPMIGGVANYYSNLVKYWPVTENIIVLDNSRKELIRVNGWWRWWPAFGTLARKLKRSRVDYILVGQILPLGSVAYFYSLWKPIKYGVFLHGMDFAFSQKSWRKKIISRLILKRANQIICANSNVAERLREIYPASPEKTVVVNPGVVDAPLTIRQEDLANLDKKYNLSPDKLILFSLGRLVRRKGFDYTILAIDSLPLELRSRICYFIGGAGPDADYLKKIVPPRISHQVFFLGKLIEEEKWAWLQKCDIFIMPARDIDGDFEGFGIVYLEANICEKAVIAGWAGGVGDAVIHNHTGLLVDSDSRSSIKEAIIKLSHHPRLRDKFGHDGRERALQDFNWEKQTAKVAKFIK